MVERQKSILVVDDSEVFLTYISMTLRRMVYDKIIPANNGADALELVTLLLPDIILLVDIPQLDGITTLRHIKENEDTAKIPVIMLASTDNTETIEACKRIGCLGYLMKPIKISALNEALVQCIVYAGGQKRKLLRTAFDKKVTITHGRINKKHYAVSLSEGGIFIRKINPFPVGTEVEVTLPLRDDERLHMRGTVIYVKCISGDFFKIVPGMAIEFKDVSDNDAKILRKYIIELLTKDIIEAQEEPVLAEDG
jgi:CheY-like chemotaxis protein